MSEKSQSPGAVVAVPQWPKLGDKLFVPDYGRHVAYLGRGSFSRYAIGYKDAADALVGRVLENDFGADLQIYPIAFLYRHYIELRLTHLLICGNQVTAGEPTFKHVHDIVYLWREARKILEQVWPDSYHEEMDAVESCIKEFSSLDVESMSFRYPVTKKGLPTLPNLDRVGLINFRDVMERLSNFLDCASDGLGDILDSMPSGADYW